MLKEPHAQATVPVCQLMPAVTQRARALGCTQLLRALAIMMIRTT